jgi:glutaconate CoA-transferase subunit A
MIMSKVMDLGEALNKFLVDGCVLCLGGISICRRPMAATYEAIRMGVKNLHLIDIAPGMPQVLLALAGSASVTEACWHGYELFGHPYMWRNIVERGPEATGYRFDDHSHYGLSLRFVAGWLGVPFIPTYTSRGSDILNPEFDNLLDLRGKSRKLPRKKFDVMKDPFYEGDEVVLLPAARPDLTIIHAQLAAPDGTARIYGAHFDDFIHAASADKVIVTCEKVVPRDALANEPEMNLIPSIYVDAVCEVPYGAHPGPCLGHYDYDPWFLGELVGATREGEKDPDRFDEWLDKWVLSVGGHDEYLEKLGVKRLLALRSDPMLGYSPGLPRRIDRLPSPP